MESCANCQAPLEPAYRFCPACGQKTQWHRFNLPLFFGEFTQAFTDLDKGILNLVKQLAIRPGIVAREYILEGRRKKYFNPFSFLLLVLGLYLSVNALTHPYTKSTIVATPASQAPTSRQSAIERQKKTQSFLEEYSNLVSMLAIPLFAAVCYLYFRSSRLYYTEHLVANVFFAGFYSLMSLLMTLVLGLFFRRYLHYLNFLQLGFQWVYLTIAYYQFLDYRHPRHYLTVAFAILLALLTWMIASAGSITLYIRYGWNLT